MHCHKVFRLFLILLSVSIAVCIECPCEDEDESKERSMEVPPTGMSAQDYAEALANTTASDDLDVDERTTEIELDPDVPMESYTRDLNVSEEDWANLTSCVDEFIQWLDDNRADLKSLTDSQKEYLGATAARFSFFNLIAQDGAYEDNEGNSVLTGDAIPSVFTIHGTIDIQANTTIAMVSNDTTDASPDNSVSSNSSSTSSEETSQASGISSRSLSADTELADALHMDEHLESSSESLITSTFSFSGGRVSLNPSTNGPVSVTNSDSATLAASAGSTASVASETTSVSVSISTLIQTTTQTPTAQTSTVSVTNIVTTFLTETRGFGQKLHVDVVGEDTTFHIMTSLRKY